MSAGLARLRGTSRRARVLIVVAVVVVVAAVVVVVVLLTRGPSSPGDVTFTAGAASVTAGPTVYCDVPVTECSTDDDAGVRLAVPPGTDLAVTVPEEVAATPWQLAFTYRDATGAEQSGRSPVFPPGQRRDYALVLPDPGARLERAEVQQYGARLVETPQGVGFSTRSTWVLTTG